MCRWDSLRHTTKRAGLAAPERHNSFIPCAGNVVFRRLTTTPYLAIPRILRADAEDQPERRTPVKYRSVATSTLKFKIDVANKSIAILLD